MSRFTLIRTAAGLVLALGLCAAGARAADPPAAADKAAENKRTVYIAKHRPAKDLAAVLSSYFQGAAVIQAVPDSFGNALLIRAAPAAFDDVVAAAEKLDQPPRTVSVEVLAAVTADPREGDEPALKDGDFTGPAAEVVARMEDLRQRGVLSGLKRVQLTLVEGRPSSILAGESRPNVAAINITATGMASRSIMYRNVGTQVRATAAVSADGTATVDLSFQDSRAYAPEDGVSIGTDEKGKPIFATEFLLTTWDGKVRLADGQAAVIRDVRTASKSGKTRLVLVVAGQIVEPDAKPEK